MVPYHNSIIVGPKPYSDYEGLQGFIGSYGGSGFYRACRALKGFRVALVGFDRALARSYWDFVGF